MKQSMSWSRRIRPVLLALLLTGVGAGRLAVAGETEKPEGYIEELKLFSKAMGVIQDAFPENIPPRKLLYEAVRGMMTLLDKYSEFIDPDKYEILKIYIKGEFAGIGVILKQVGDYPGVRGVQPDSAAMKAGILPEDKILKINGKTTEKMPLPEVAKQLRGEAGTTLVLTLHRMLTGKIFDLTIQREKIEIQSVQDVRLIGRAIGYIRVDNWSDNTPEQADQAIQGLETQGMQALIIDLRNNGGGLMPKAVALASRFLPEGDKVLTVDSKIKEQRAEYFSEGERPRLGFPLVVLVNEKSASASEIFTAAMQDHQRGKVIGAQTFGKASVQSVIPLDDQSAMKMTTARYLSPSGRDLNRVGIVPDEKVVNEPSGTPKGDKQMLRALEILHSYM
ncbi:MAG: S41 family peptidase [Candidatus Omnitrophota bacterium]